jgi:hypothetical protein
MFCGFAFLSSRYAEASKAQALPISVILARFPQLVTQGRGCETAVRVSRRRCQRVHISPIGFRHINFHGISASPCNPSKGSFSRPSM